MGDPYYNDGVFLAGFESSLVDESPLAQSGTASGGPALSSAQARFGTQSLSCPGTGSCTFPDNAAFAIGTQNYTIEGFFRFTDVTSYQSLIGQWRDSSQAAFLLNYEGGSNTLQLYNASSVGDTAAGSANVTGGPFTPVAGTWYHIAADYDGSMHRVYVDGTTVGAEFFGASNIPDSSQALSLGFAYSPANAVVDRFTGYMDEVRITVGVARYATDSGFTPPSEAFPREDDTNRVVSEGIEFDEASGFGTLELVTVAEGVSVALIANPGYLETASDDIGASYRLIAVRAQPALAEDDISVEAAVTVHQGVVMLERLRIALAQVPNHKFQLALPDGVSLTELARVAFPVTIALNVAIEAELRAQHAITVLERLGLLRTVAAAFTYNKTLADTIRSADALLNFFGASASDGIGTADTAHGIAAKLGALSDTLGIEQAALNPVLILSVTAEDTIELSHDDVLNFLTSIALTDAFQLSAAYVSPGSTYTTWVMNTRSGAVTEYDNFAFNSFAQMGHKYIAASEDGLYELIGDDDDGTDIVSRIKSGFMKWAGAKFTMFKAAYLAVRGGGDYVLKITTGDGKSYSYGVSARDMRNTKVNVGKGIRTQYFAFELISDGDDYELEMLEFVPIVTDRRV